jgi:hypothetical protein
MLAVLVGRTSRSRYCGLLLLAITAIDLAVANRCLILSAPASVMSTKSLLADREREGTTPLRYYRNPDRLWVPARWKTERDVGRAATALAWDRATLFPRFGLMEQLSSVRSPGTMVPYEYALWLRATLDRVDGLPSQYVLDATGTAYVLTSRRVTASRADQLRLVDQHGEQNVQVWRNEEGTRRTWIVRQIVAIPELSRADARSPAAQHQRTLDVLQPAGRPRNFGQSAVVELPAGGTLPLWKPGPGESTARPGEDRCAISHYGRHGVVVEATLTEPGLLVLNDQFWPWWTARVSVDGQPPRRIPILKTNRVMRGVYLPSGRHTITFAYQPVRQYLALVASAVAWLALAVCLAVGRNRKGKD